MAATAATKQRILDEIGCPHLKLYKDSRSSYFYFVYDDGRDFETKSVYVAHLSNLPLSHWVADGRELVAACEARRANGGRAVVPKMFRLEGVM